MTFRGCLRFSALGLAAGLCCTLPGQPGRAQSRPFNPGENPISNQGYNSVAATPSDTTVLTPTRAIFNGAAAACNIAITPNGSSTAVTFQNVQPGEILPVQATKIMATGTTCTNMVAIF